jgi:pyruvate ferredoxin oxidoreductase gamma subunit
MYRIRIHGRGGQGIKMASRVLGTALFHCGFTVQDAPKYGAERRGAPIFSNVRAAHQPINERGTILNPNLVIVADDTLLAVPAAGALQGITADCVVLINSRESAETWRQRLNFPARVLILPAPQDMEDRAELSHIGATCAGAAACLLGLIDREALADAIAKELAEHGADIVTKNCDSALAAYDAMAQNRGVVLEGTAISAETYTAPSWIDLPFDEARISAPAIRASANSVQVRTGLWRTMRPIIDYDHCNKCWWVCSTFCPDSAIEVKDNKPIIDYDHCKGCMVCVGICPPHAIQAIPEYLAQHNDSAAANHPAAGAGEADD